MAEDNKKKSSGKSYPMHPNYGKDHPLSRRTHHGSGATPISPTRCRKINGAHGPSSKIPIIGQREINR